MTKSRFFLVKADEGGEAKPALLDQDAIFLALKVLEPNLNHKVCWGVSLNIMLRYGLNADLNGDGVVSPEEWAALENVLANEYGVEEDVRNPLAPGKKSRLITLMMRR